MSVPLAAQSEQYHQHFQELFFREKQHLQRLFYREKLVIVQKLRQAKTLSERGRLRSRLNELSSMFQSRLSRLRRDVDQLREICEQKGYLHPPTSETCASQDSDVNHCRAVVKYVPPSEGKVAVDLLQLKIFPTSKGISKYYDALEFLVRKTIIRFPKIPRIYTRACNARCQVQEILCPDIVSGAGESVERYWTEQPNETDADGSPCRALVKYVPLPHILQLKLSPANRPLGESINAEDICRKWAELNPMCGSRKEPGEGCRHDSIEDGGALEDLRVAGRSHLDAKRSSSTPTTKARVNASPMASPSKRITKAGATPAKEKDIRVCLYFEENQGPIVVNYRVPDDERFELTEHKAFNAGKLFDKDGKPTVV